jgi:hypothetical protein
VRLSDGGVAPATGDAHACAQLPDDKPRGDPGCQEVQDSQKYWGRVQGMNVTTSRKAPGGPTILIGQHESGTEVPMIAAIDGAVWKSDVPADEPLQTRPDGKAAITSTRVFVDYETEEDSDVHGLAAFDFNGHRLWEIRLTSQQPLTAIQATEQHVFVSQWGELRAFDTATGKKSFAIGTLF